MSAGWAGSPAMTMVILGWARCFVEAMLLRSQLTSITLSGSERKKSAVLELMARGIELLLGVGFPRRRRKGTRRTKWKKSIPTTEEAEIKGPTVGEINPSSAHSTEKHFEGCHDGGVSDSTLRAKLASKATAAGVKDAKNILQLLWPGHAATLRSTSGNPTVIKSVVVALARKEGIAVESLKEGEDPVYSNDPWAGATSTSAGSKPSQQSGDGAEKFEALTLHSTLQTPEGPLSRVEVTDIGCHSSGYVFLHATRLSESLPTIRAAGTPLVVITHRNVSATYTETAMGAQLVVSPPDGVKRVTQVTLILFSMDTIEVVQHAAVLNIPTLQRYDIVMEMFEEQASSSAFATWLRKGELDAVLGSYASLFAPLATGNHRTTGEPPGRVIRRTGSVPTSDIMSVLACSGTEAVNIKLCRQSIETDVGLSMVWPQTMDREALDAQLQGVRHTGILRTKVGKFMVRCTVDQLPLVRQAVCQEDTRFKHAPNLVVTRKWRVSNVPADLSAQRLSEALQLCHKWEQVPIGPPNPKGKGPTWSPLLGSATPPPQQQLLIADHLCVITEIGAQASIPRATILAGNPISTASTIPSGAARDCVSANARGTEADGDPPFSAD
eukprot:2055174-Amphidinium_carterae.1